MHELGLRYGKHYNHRCHRVGPIFQGRYRALLVDLEHRGREVAKYIHLNPVKAKIAETPEEYRWSSYRECVGKVQKRFSDVDLVLDLFKGTRSGRVRHLRSHTLRKGGAGYDPETSAIGGLIVGGKRFVEWLRREKVSRRRPANVSRWRELQRPSAGLKRSMEKRVAAVTGDGRLRRKLLAYALKHSTPLSLGDVARMVGMGSVSAVSQAVRRLSKERKDDQELDGAMLELEKGFRKGQ